MAELLGKHLAHLQDPGATPFPGAIQPAKRRASRTPSGAGSSRRWIVAGVVLLLLAATFSVTEATGVTHVSATVIRIVTGEGTLVIEIDDPRVKVSIDGEQVRIIGAGVEEVRLRPGRYKVQVSKDGQPVKTELVSITHGGRRVVRVSQESVNTVGSNVATPEPGAFVVFNREGMQIRRFDTLADAVFSSSAGDTVEIRGNGPFPTDPLSIKSPLTIKAADGYLPVLVATIKLGANGRSQPLIKQSAPLVLEGLKFDCKLAVDKYTNANAGTCISSRSALHIANCQFFNNKPYGAVSSLSNLWIVNSDLTGPPPAASLGHWTGRSFVLSLRNCILSTIDLSVYDGQQAEVTLTHNTLSTRVEMWRLWPNLEKPTDSPSDKKVVIRGTNNIYDIKSEFVGFVLLGDTKRAWNREFAENWYATHIDWHEQQSVFSDRHHSRTNQNGNDSEVFDVFQELLNSESSSGVAGTDLKIGTVRFAGGTLKEHLKGESNRLTTQDYQLRSDSAGYRGGPNGEDLGANIDFVGPGEAYERWKKTPAYQKWLKEIAESSSVPAAQ